jgi:ABC-type transport system substrate-binding protein
MAEQYARVGITLEIVEHQDRAAYSEMVREKRINDAACFDSSPRSTYRVLREKLHSGLQGPWWEGYDNPEVNALIEEAEATFSDPERQALYREIYSIVREDAPWIFLYRPTRYWGVSSKLKDWEPRADGLLIGGDRTGRVRSPPRGPPLLSSGEVYLTVVSQVAQSPPKGLKPRSVGLVGCGASAS